jgi:hypothetical protein
MKSTIERISLHHAIDTRPVDPPAKSQNTARLRTNYEMLVIDGAFHAPWLIRPFEMARNHAPVLSEIKELGRSRSVRVVAVQSPLARDAGGLFLRRRLLGAREVAGEDRQGETKDEDIQAKSLHTSSWEILWQAKSTGIPERFHP